MALRLHRVTDEQWRLLAASRRACDLAGPPARASIGAIEIELRALAPEPSGASEPAAGRASAAG